MRPGALVCATTLCWVGLAWTASAQETVHLLSYEGAITPVSAEYLIDGIEDAEVEGAHAVVIRLDTPGGLDTAMRSILKSMLGAEIPIIVYVAPSGSRAASAGAFITLAAHVAAMSPGTNIGSASPVSMMGATVDSTMYKKIMHDSIAYIESIATQRGRNVELAKAFVEEAENVPAEAALERNVIDVIANDLDSLLDQIDGMEVETESGSTTLATKDAIVDERPMSLRLAILKRLVDPNIAYILLLIGIYGLFFELSNPGALAPGILGGICLLLALFAMQSLPTNYAGVALLLLGTVLLILEVKVTSYGALTLGGLTALVLGSLLLFESPGEWARVSLKVMIPGLAGFAGFFVLCVWLVVRSQGRPVVTGMSTLIGLHARAVDAIEPSGLGKVVMRGEVWDASATDGVEQGQTVEVMAVEGRTVRVRPLP